MFQYLLNSIVPVVTFLTLLVLNPEGQKDGEVLLSRSEFRLKSRSSKLAPFCSSEVSVLPELAVRHLC